MIAARIRRYLWRRVGRLLVGAGLAAYASSADAAGAVHAKQLERK